MTRKGTLLAATAAALCASAAHAERGSDGQLNILYWQAVSIMTPYLSSGTKDLEAASLVLEPLARFNEEGEIVPYLERRGFRDVEIVDHEAMQRAYLGRRPIAAGVYIATGRVA